MRVATCLPHPVRNALYEKMAASEFLETEEVTLKLVPVEGPAGPDPMDPLLSSVNELLPEEKVLLSAVLPGDMDLAKMVVSAQQLQTIRSYQSIAARQVAEEVRLIDGSVSSAVSDPQPTPHFAKCHPNC